jgi:integrase
LGRVRFSAWVEEWQQTTNNIRPTAAVRDRMLVDRYLLARFGPLPLATIGQRDVRAWITELSAKGLAPATVHKCYQILTKILAAAVAGGMLPRSPCRQIPLPRIERAEMRFLTVTEVRCLAVAVGPAYRALILLGAYGGLRIGEMAGLRRKRLDLAAGVVEVAEVVTEMHDHLYWGRPRRRLVGVGLACLGWWWRRCRSIWLAGRSSRTASCSPSPTVPRCAPRAPARGCGVPRPGPPAWKGCASTTCGIRRSPWGSRLALVPRRSPRALGMRW